MSRTPPPNTGTRCGSSDCRTCASSGKAATRIDAPAMDERNDAFAWRLRNRSALLLLATAVRLSNGISRSSSRVSSTRRPSRPSSAAFTRRAAASVTVFSASPPAPFVPSSAPPWPGSITTAKARRPEAERAATWTSISPTITSRDGTRKLYSGWSDRR